MKQTVHKAVKTGYGLGLLSFAQAKKVASSVKKELGLNDQECLKLAKELVSGSEKASRDILNTAEKHFERALIKSGLASESKVKNIKHAVKIKVMDVKERLKAKVEKSFRSKK